MVEKTGPKPFKEPVALELNLLDLGAFQSSPESPQQNAIELLEGQASTLLADHGQLVKIDGAAGTILPTTVKAPFTVDGKPVFATLAQAAPSKGDIAPDPKIVFTRASKFGKRVHTMGEQLLPIEFRSVESGGLNLGTKLLTGHKNSDSSEYDVDKPKHVEIAEGIITKLGEYLRPANESESQPKSIQKYERTLRDKIIYRSQVGGLCALVGTITVGPLVGLAVWMGNDSARQDQENAAGRDRFAHAQDAYRKALPIINVQIQRDGFKPTDIKLTDANKVDIINHDESVATALYGNDSDYKDERPVSSTFRLIFDSCTVSGVAQIKYPTKTSREPVDIHDYEIANNPNIIYQNAQQLRKALGNNVCGGLLKQGK